MTSKNFCRVFQLAEFAANETDKGFLAAGEMVIVLQPVSIGDTREKFSKHKGILKLQAIKPDILYRVAHMIK